MTLLPELDATRTPSLGDRVTLARQLVGRALLRNVTLHVRRVRGAAAGINAVPSCPIRQLTNPRVYAAPPGDREQQHHRKHRGGRERVELATAQARDRVV